MELEGQSVVVVGLARSGVAAARFLAGRGARVVATDRKPARELETEALKLEDSGVKLEVGEHQQGTFTGASLIVVSPGVPWNLPELEAARRAGVPVIAELELGFRQITGTVAAVTGTKGKSTTTAALGAMLKQTGEDVRVGGNIGHAVTGLLEGAGRETLFVLEVSSFQLEGTELFRPHVAVFLNFSADHLDRHATLAEYENAKARIFRNQTSEDWAVLNADDASVMRLAAASAARRLLFSAAQGHDRSPLAERERGRVAYFEDGWAWVRLEAKPEALFSLASVRLPGAHLAGDLLAAAASARLLGASAEAIANAVARFDGVEHVLERVAEIGGVVFFNDSKATNVDAAEKSLTAFDRPVLAILGGRYKGGDFASLGGAAKRHVKAIFAIGEARERIVSAFSGVVPVFGCDSLHEAVVRAYAAAEPGDAVLLAPACSSFDMFRDYADRGNAFKSEVGKLSQEVQA